MMIPAFQILVNGLSRLLFDEENVPKSLLAKERCALGRFPFLCRLDEEQRTHFIDLCTVFLDKVAIDGMEGIVPTTEERVRLAASCALLYVGRPEWDFPPVSSVHISLSSFDDESYLPAEDGKWAGYYCPGKDAVYLRRNAIRRSFCSTQDGYHTVLHEFAHALDDEDGVVDGNPARLFAEMRGLWGPILERERNKAGEADAALRRYGSKNLKETFATSVEGFFEQPLRLKGKAPDLYVLLASYLNQDPAKHDEGIFDDLCATVSPIVSSRKAAVLDGADIREGKAFMHCPRPAYSDSRGLYICYRTKRGTWSLPKPARLHLLAKDVPWKPETEIPVTLEIVGHQPRRVSHWGKFPPLLSSDMNHALDALGKKDSFDPLLREAIEKVWHASLLGEGVDE